MSLEDLLARAKKARKEGTGGDGGPRVEKLPTKGKITEYGTVPPEELARAEAQHRLSPDDAEAQVYLAFLHYAGKRYDEAIRHFTQLLESGFKPANQHFYLGNCYYQMGRKGDARTEWEACLSGEPSEHIEKMVRERLTWLVTDSDE